MITIYPTSPLSAQSSNAPILPPQPHIPLDGVELEAAVALLKQSGNLSEEAFFVSGFADEPDKEVVLGFKAGTPFERVIRLIGHDPKQKQSFDARVSLTKNELVQFLWIEDGQAAVTGDGLIGRISGVGSRSSRLLLITDLNSRIPIVIEATRTRAVLAGTNTGRPRMIHLPTGAAVAIGDRVVTSGHGGGFPSGLPIGVVTMATDGVIEVQPYVNRERIEYVRVLDYELTGVIQSGPDRQTGSHVR